MIFTLAFSLANCFLFTKLSEDLPSGRKLKFCGLELLLVKT